MFERNKQEIEQVIERYLSASYNGNSQEMHTVFHPDAHIYGIDELGALSDWTIADFAKLVGSGKSPAAMGQTRDDEIIAIRFTGEKTAAAFVTLRLFNTRYTDVLNFIYIDGRWQVIAKMLSAEKLDEQ